MNVMYTLTHDDKRYTPIHSEIGGIEGIITPLLTYDTLDIDELFKAVQKDRLHEGIDFVSMEEVRNTIGDIVSFNIRVGTIHKVLEHYLFVCKEDK